MNIAPVMINKDYIGTYSDKTMSSKCKGGACCVLACRRIRKRKSDEGRSSSEGSEDEESELKKKYPRTFHR